MIFDWREATCTPDDIPMPAKAFDANGIEITDHVQRLDTETGECLVIYFNKDGTAVMNAERTELATATVIHPPPLRVTDEQGIEYGCGHRPAEACQKEREK